MSSRLRSTQIVLVLLLASAAFVLILALHGSTSVHGPPQFAAQTSTGAVWMVGVKSTDSSALPNTGVRGVLQVIRLQTNGSLAFWVSDDLSNNLWGQVGYFISGGGAPIAFFQIWNLNTSTIVFEGSAPTTTGLHAFAMYLRNGTTWDYAVDSFVFGSYDMGSSSSSTSYPVYALSEEQANHTFPFPPVSFGPALQVLRAGSWSLVRYATSYGDAWGIQGTAQNSSLTRGQVLMGGSVGEVPAGSTLWSFPHPQIGGSSATAALPQTVISSPQRNPSARQIR